MIQIQLDAMEIQIYSSSSKRIKLKNVEHALIMSTMIMSIVTVLWMLKPLMNVQTMQQQHASAPDSSMAMEKVTLIMAALHSELNKIPKTVSKLLRSMKEQLKLRTPVKNHVLWMIVMIESLRLSMVLAQATSVQYALRLLITLTELLVEVFPDVGEKMQVKIMLLNALLMNTFASLILKLIGWPRVINGQLSDVPAQQHLLTNVILVQWLAGNIKIALRPVPIICFLHVILVFMRLL